jgi:O-acetyl-ADP-ribose deacetylase (regulator of RNase III)
MIINTVNGNLLDLFDRGTFNGIVQGCNCHHMMGAGIAGQIAGKYPAAVHADRATPIGSMKLGKYSMADIPGKGILVNMYTQDQGGREKQATLAYSIARGFTALNYDCMRLFSDFGVQTNRRTLIGIPLIGAGIAGGDWAIHEAIINAVTPDIDIVVVKFVPAA